MDVTYATAWRGLIWCPAARRDVDMSFFRRDDILLLESKLEIKHM